MAKPRQRRAAPASPSGEALPKAKRTKRESDGFVDAAFKIEGWAPASEALDRVTSVATVFPDFNRAVRVGGLPVRRIHTVHGPTHGGKSAFVLGLVKSFVDAGHMAGYIDAEHSLGQEFATEIVRDLEHKPNFQAARPESYEKTIVAADAFLGHVAGLRRARPELKSILVVDSINKLVPERELDKILKSEVITDAGAKEMTKGHFGRYRAALNQAWLDQLTPKIAKAECALIVVAQEREDNDPTNFFADFKVKGGAAILFDASIVMRVLKSSPVFDVGADKSNDSIIGHAHRVRIWKSKVGHMDGRHTDCLFHLSNGKLVPSGLDTARDAVVVGMKLGLVQQAGSWVTFAGTRWQGLAKSVMSLTEDREKLAGLLTAIAKKLDENEGRTT